MRNQLLRINQSKNFLTLKSKQRVTPYEISQFKNLSNVDIAWLPVLHRAAIIEKYSGYDFLDAYPKLKGVQQHLLKSGLGSKSVAHDFEDIFSQFYLSPSTWLGQRAKMESKEINAE